jgi:hypothetical protein
LYVIRAVVSTPNPDSDRTYTVSEPAVDDATRVDERLADTDGDAFLKVRAKQRQASPPPAADGYTPSSIFSKRGALPDATVFDEFIWPTHSEKKLRPPLCA